jgi:alpha-tubulin suppressor-like RCC1 family protein
MGVASVAIGAAYQSVIRAITGTLMTKVVTKLSSGFWHSMAITSDAKVFVWGSIGLLYSSSPTYSGSGDGTGTGSNIPVLIDNSVFENKIAIDVSSGWYNTMVLTSDGSIFAAGINTNYQLGGTCYIIY